jgi:hypothetical protein
MAQQPTYQAYTVVKREGQDDYWLNIGAAFEHADQNGLNLVLQALPIDGKIVLRLPKSQPETTETPPAREGVVRDIRQRRREK